jgi:hypothetical protein
MVRLLRSAGDNTEPDNMADTETEWTTFHSQFMEAAAQALPRPVGVPRQRHITAATVELSAAKAGALLAAKAARLHYSKAPTAENRIAMEEADAAFKAANRQCRQSASADLEKFLEAEAQALAQAYEARHTRVVFNKIKSLTGRTRAAPIASINSHLGEPTTEPQAIADVLAVHSERTLNVESSVTLETLNSIGDLHPPSPPPLTEPPTLRMGPQTRHRTSMADAATARLATAQNEAAEQARPAQTSGDSPPTLGEVMTAIQQLKDTAPGNCEVTALMLKLTGNAGAERLHRVIATTWAAGRCPKSWKEATLTYIYKGKGARLLPDNYRGISLLSVCGKVYTNILIARIKPIIEPTLHEAQCGFRASRSCADQLFSLRRLCELSRAAHKPLYAAFVDYRKAFDSVNRDAIWKLLTSRGVPAHIVALVQDMYDGCSGEVLVQGYKSRKFEMRTGVRQGCALSPLLFNLFMDHIVRASFSSAEEEALGFPIASDMDGLLHTPGNPRSHPHAIFHYIAFLLYADDLVLLSHSKEGLASLLERLESTSTTWGMTINYEKTKAMQFHTPSQSHTPPSPIVLQGGSIIFVPSFLYLGNLFSQDGGLQQEVDSRIAKTKTTCASLMKLWKNQNISRRVKNLVFKAYIPATLLYGCETWALTQALTYSLEVALHDCLRMSMDISRSDRIRNEDIRTACNHRDISNITREHRLRFLGHLARRPDSRISKQLLFATHTTLAEGQPRQGTHTIIHSFKADLEAAGLTTNWYLEAQDRNAWRAGVREATDMNPDNTTN